MHVGELLPQAKELSEGLASSNQRCVALEERVGLLEKGLSEAEGKEVCATEPTKQKKAKEQDLGIGMIFPGLTSCPPQTLGDSAEQPSRRLRLVLALGKHDGAVRSSRHSRS